MIESTLTPSMQYLYLHGFASSPHSKKARDLHDRFHQIGRSLQVLDLNQNDFTHLTLTRQIQQVLHALPPTSEPVTLLGSSFGGLTATWAAQQAPQIVRLVLLAPAFGFLAHWLPRLGTAQLQQWQETGFLSVYHHGADTMQPLSYQFVTDAQTYEDADLQRSLPTLILHGIHDDVIPIAASRTYVSHHPGADLIELDSDHALTNVSETIWPAIQQFCQLA